MVIFFNSVMNLLLIYVENKAVQTTTLLNRMYEERQFLIHLNEVLVRQYLSNTPALPLAIPAL